MRLNEVYKIKTYVMCQAGTSENVHLLLQHTESEGQMHQENTQH